MIKKSWNLFVEDFADIFDFWTVIQFIDVIWYSIELIFHSLAGVLITALANFLNLRETYG
jgi:hypothetical protein